MGRRPMPFDERYEPITETGCWIWLGKTDKDGYGVIHTNYKFVKAHRFALGVHNSSDKSLCVLHKCDIPQCVNPDHLYIGSQKDNVRDMYKRGRKEILRGERLSKKLIEENVLTIRKDTRTLEQIAKDYKLSITTVSNIKNRKTWKHI